jgi:hypothetical protein
MLTTTTNDTPPYTPTNRAEQLDLAPTPPQRALLEQLENGLELALDPQGQPQIRQTGRPVARGTVAALVRRRWLSGPPGMPLLDPPAAITERGQRALRLRPHRRR